MSSSSDPLAGILADSEHLDPQLGERGMIEGRRTSTPLSRRAPADLDVLVLTDPRTGILATLMHWAGRVRWGKGVPAPAVHTISSETAVLVEHWAWALWQPWAPRMIEELETMAARLHEHRYGVPIQPCPVCGEPVRVDSFAREHRECIDTPLE